MAQAQVVYSGLTDGSAAMGNLFKDMKFWIAMRCPMRSSFVEQVKSNGGEVVPLEQMADILIVDHARRDTAPGSHSYTFIEQSIKNGQLEDLDAHVAGPPVGSIRPVGSARPAKGGRVPFTAEDDRVLSKWVKDFERKGGKVLGNDIYKQLESVNNRHTWQSWRDRYIKYVSLTATPAEVPPNATPSPSADAAVMAVKTPKPVQHEPLPLDQSLPRDPVEASQNTQYVGSQRADAQPLKAEIKELVTAAGIQPETWIQADYDDLLRSVPDIESNRLDTYRQGWKKWAEAWPDHTADDWRNFYEKVVLPVYNRLEHVHAETLQQKKPQGNEGPSIKEKTKLQRHGHPAKTMQSDAERLQSEPQPSDRNDDVEEPTPVTETQHHEPEFAKSSDERMTTLASDWQSTLRSSEPNYTASPSKKRFRMDGSVEYVSGNALSYQSSSKKLKYSMPLSEDPPSYRRRSSPIVEGVEILDDIVDELEQEAAAASLSKEAEELFYGNQDVAAATLPAQAFALRADVRGTLETDDSWHQLSSSVAGYESAPETAGRLLSSPTQQLWDELQPSPKERTLSPGWSERKGREVHIGRQQHQSTKSLAAERLETSQLSAQSLRTPQAVEPVQRSPSAKALQRPSLDQIATKDLGSLFGTEVREIEERSGDTYGENFEGFSQDTSETSVEEAFVERTRKELNGAEQRPEKDGEGIGDNLEEEDKNRDEGILREDGAGNMAQDEDEDAQSLEEALHIQRTKAVERRSDTGSPSLPMAPPVRSGALNENQDEEAWTALQKSRGFTDDEIVDALFSTCLKLELADEVLSAMVDDGGVPRNMRGVWTARDDEVLRDAGRAAAQESREDEGVWSSREAEVVTSNVRRLMDKHGAKAIEERRAFFRLREEVEEEERRLQGG